MGAIKCDLGPGFTLTSYVPEHPDWPSVPHHYATAGCVALDVMSGLVNNPIDDDFFPPIDDDDRRLLLSFL